ncbi:integrase [Methylolobus aquaticus]|nr:integrase [Methylolobus aquaticus]
MVRPRPGQRGLAHPADNAKNGRAFTIPIPATVAAWFEDLRSLAGGSPWVLPARGRGRRTAHEHISASTLNAALKRIEGARREPSPHDLRSTARSYLAELGVPVIVAERCLNHALGGLVDVYDKHDYMDERRRALELWAAFIETAERGEAWNVTPIRATAGA